MKKAKSKFREIIGASFSGLDTEMSDQYTLSVYSIKEVEGNAADIQSHPIEISVNAKTNEQMNAGQTSEFMGIRLSIQSAEGVIKQLQESIKRAKSFKKKFAGMV